MADAISSAPSPSPLHHYRQSSQVSPLVHPIAVVGIFHIFQGLQSLYNLFQLKFNLRLVLLDIYRNNKYDYEVLNSLLGMLNKQPNLHILNIDYS
jgi:hypothetical protein